MARGLEACIRARRFAVTANAFFGAPSSNAMITILLLATAAVQAAKLKLALFALVGTSMAKIRVYLFVAMANVSGLRCVMMATL